MERQTILDNENATLWYYPDAGIIHHQFHRKTCGPELRAVFKTGLDLLRKSGARKWLSDERENERMSMEDAEWIENIWYPQAQTAGWAYWAVIPPKEHIGQISFKRILADMAQRRRLTFQVFEEPDSALAWLASL
jgi:hypothetical protein